MAVKFLITFTTFFLENENFVCFASIVKNSSLYNGIFNIRSTKSNSSVIVNEKYFCELYRSIFSVREAVAEDFLSGFNFELLAGNVNDCVHFKKNFESFGRKRFLRLGPLAALRMALRPSALGAEHFASSFALQFSHKGPQIYELFAVLQNLWGESFERLAN